MTRDELREKIARELAEILNLDWNLMPSFEDHFSSPTTHEGLRLMANRILALIPPQPKLEWDDMDCLRVGKVVVGYVGLCRTEDKEKKRAAVEQAVKEALGWTR